MGMFDSVRVPCPQCGKEVEAQTKSGECMLEWYNLDKAPQDVLVNVNRHAPFYCSSCKIKFQVEFFCSKCGSTATRHARTVEVKKKKRRK